MKYLKRKKVSKKRKTRRRGSTALNSATAGNVNLRESVSSTATTTHQLGEVGYNDGSIAGSGTVAFAAAALSASCGDLHSKIVLVIIYSTLVYCPRRRQCSLGSSSYNHSFCLLLNQTSASSRLRLSPLLMVVRPMLTTGIPATAAVSLRNATAAAAVVFGGAPRCQWQ